jgi:glycosyltransferase involved in cell wall biosynthesis
MNNKAVFITSHSHPSVDSSFEALKKAFPQTEFDYIHLPTIVRKNKKIFLLAAFHAVRTYWLDLLLRRKKPLAALTTTPYMYWAIRAKIHELLKGKNYDFSFQIGSLYDASFPGLPHFVYTDHTYMENTRYPDYKPSSLPKRKWLELEAKIYGNATLNFTRSSNITASMVNDYHCDPKKIVCVYAGNNAAYKGSLSKGKDSYSSKKILFVGNFWERKGGPELIKAFSLVHEKHSDAQLFILGAKPEIELPGVQAIGKVPITELYKYYMEAAVFCLPTRWEPFGIAFLEALSFKLPVVATRLGAIPDFIRDNENGYLIKPGDAEDLSRKLLALIEDPAKCEEFGETGYEIYQENYSWENVSQKFKENIGKHLIEQ